METALLHSLGLRLRDERIRRNDSQAKFAARIGVSIPTLRKMEEGDPSVRIGHWFAALSVLGREKDFDALLAPQEDLFARFEKMTAPVRKRAARSSR